MQPMLCTVYTCTCSYDAQETPDSAHLLLKGTFEGIHSGGEVGHAVLIHAQHEDLALKVLAQCAQLVLKCLQQLRREGDEERYNG